MFIKDGTTFTDDSTHSKKQLSAKNAWSEIKQTSLMISKNCLCKQLSIILLQGIVRKKNANSMLIVYIYMEKIFE